MAEDGARAGPAGVDPRSAALARYLRRMAATFSMSADATNTSGTAEYGMALLDAAMIAEAMPSRDPRITILSEVGLFESMPDGEAVFIELPAIRSSVQRPLVSGREDGSTIIAKIVAAATAPDEPFRE